MFLLDEISFDSYCDSDSFLEMSPLNILVLTQMNMRLATLISLVRYWRYINI